MKGKFLRSNQQMPVFNFDYLLQLVEKNKRASRKSSQNRPSPSSTGKKKLSGKAKEMTTGKVKRTKESKTNPYNFDSFQAIVASECYQRINKHFVIMKTQMDEICRELKSEIVNLNQEIAQGEVKNAGLSNIKDSLISEVNYLVEMESEIKLKNYQLRCQLNHNAHGGPNYYDSQQDIPEDQFGYEEMMQLRDQIGVVGVGYGDKTIKNMEGELYLENKDESERCCICCFDIERDDRVFKTQCGHTHHLVCLRHWLKIQKKCPLCRCQIELA